MRKYSLILLFLALCSARDQNVLMTEVFEIIVDPPMFNWTYEGRKDQFTYEATLANAPDLPSWVHYVYSERHHSGFLYGVPPSQYKPVVPLQIVGLNKKSYETRVENVNIVIQEKLNPARYEVHMKIDNLNVEDMFEVDRMEALKDIFRRHLWKDSEEDLYVTFLESAVEMGARKPLNPNEGEGVVVRLGSEVLFSSELLELQEEVRPLYKLLSCPRDFKRTSVERLFRDEGFTLDWCSFRLFQKDENNNSAMHKSDYEKTDSEFEPQNDQWIPVSREEIPDRSYNKELVMTVTIPMVIMIVLVFALTFILCFEHDDIIGLSEETVISTQEQSSPQRFISPKNPTDTLQSLSLGRDHSISPDPMLLSRNHSDSPNCTVNRGLHCRPSPPPYVRPKFKPEI